MEIVGQKSKYNCKKKQQACKYCKMCLKPGKSQTSIFFWFVCLFCHSTKLKNFKNHFKAEKENEGRGEKQKETPQAAQTLWELVRMYENTQYIRPKFHFLTKIKMTQLMFLFCYLLFLCFQSNLKQGHRQLFSVRYSQDRSQEMIPIIQSILLQSLEVHAQISKLI